MLRAQAACRGNEGALLQSFPLCTRLAVVCVWIDGQTTARRKLAPHLDVLRIHQLHKVFHNDVDAVLVKVPVIAETKQI